MESDNRTTDRIATSVDLFLQECDRAWAVGDLTELRSCVERAVIVMKAQQNILRSRQSPPADSGVPHKDFGRWNCETTDDGFRICRGLHEKAHDCEWEYYVPRRAPEPDGCHGLDTPQRICFYEQDFYVLSNFSSFVVQRAGVMFPTSEHAYHWAKFPDDPLKQAAIRTASSAHDAFKMAERWKPYRRLDWDQTKVDVMRDILYCKVSQHEYVRRKLLATGDRELVENSWRDDYWGWGPNRDGQNMLGKLWMEVRAEIRRSTTKRDGNHD